jgi:hypothetical protein
VSWHLTARHACAVHVHVFNKLAVPVYQTRLYAESAESVEELTRLLRVPHGTDK